MLSLRRKKAELDLPGVNSVERPLAFMIEFHLQSRKITEENKHY